MTLEFLKVTKRFGALVAIDDVSLAFRPGLVHGIIGPNGAGKSTLINMAAGSYAVTGGSIRLDGRPLERLKKHEISVAGIARTYQNIRLFDQMSVIENLEVCLYPEEVRHAWKEVLLPGYSRRRRAARLEHCSALLEEFDLRRYAQSDAESLPYGRQRMLEIARALVRRPRVLLLDEPAAGLNHAETAELRERIDRLRQEELVIVVVEHDMDLVMTLCDRIVVMHQGKLLFAGTPAEVQASQEVQHAYLGTADDLDSIRSLAEDRRTQRGLRAHADPVRH